MGVDIVDYLGNHSLRIEDLDEKQDFCSHMKNFFTNEKSKFLIGFCLLYIIISSTFNIIIFAI